VSTADELVAALASPHDNVTLQLSPGEYRLPSTPASEEVWDCRGSATMLPTSVGLVISGHRVRLLGSDNASTIVTDAGFKLYFKDCEDCEVDGLVVSGPFSGAEPDANNAAIVAVRSSVVIRNCTFNDLAGARNDDAPGGDAICARKGARLTIESNEITSGSWGIVLQKGAQAVIRNNRITGMNPVSQHGGAMLITCDAAATVDRNLVQGFAGGIRVTAKGSLACTANIIEDIQEDGISTAGDNVGRMRIDDNVFFRCGGAGIAIRAEGDQKATRNIVVQCGGVQPRRSAVYASGAKSDAAVRKNTLYDNTVTDPKLDRDVSREAFWRARRSWTRTYRNTPVGVDGRHKFYESAFLTRYGRWAD
jgi:hypothetical protein